MVSGERLAIAQVTPFAWEVGGDVNEYVARVSDELTQRGHRVLIIAPSQSDALVRDSRRAIRSQPEELLAQAESEPLVLGGGEVLPFSPARRRAASIPVDVARTIEQALGSLALDIVDVHEPFAPSASAGALRHSRALNVGSFHAPTERLLSTQLTRPLTRLLFARLDARIVSYTATRNLLQRYFPGEYRVITPGADAAPPRAPGLRPPQAAWRAPVWSPRPMAPPATLGRRLRDRVTFIDAGDCSQDEALARADVAVFASEGDRAIPGTLLRALGSGAATVASRLPVYEEILGEGERGVMFGGNESET